MKITHEAGKYVLYKEKTVIGTAALEDGRLWVEIDRPGGSGGTAAIWSRRSCSKTAGMTSNARPALSAGPAADEAAGPY